MSTLNKNDLHNKNKFYYCCNHLNVLEYTIILGHTPDVFSFKVMTYTNDTRVSLSGNVTPVCIFHFSEL